MLFGRGGQPSATSHCVRGHRGRRLGRNDCGIFATFVPGWDVVWFGVASVCAAFGLLSPSRRGRMASVVMVIGLGLCAWLSYHDWLRYQQWLQQRGPM